jgi:hypothetical protein
MTTRDKRYAEWLASHVNKWGHPPSPGEAWDEAERQALERAVKACQAVEFNWNAEKGVYTNACDDCSDAILALLQDAQSGEEKHDD